MALNQNLAYIKNSSSILIILNILKYKHCVNILISPVICHVTIFIIDQLVAGLRREIGKKLDYEWSPFFLRDSGVNETRARVKITPRKKGGTRWGGRKT